MTQATLKEWAMNNGIEANIKSMSQAQKVMLRYQYVLANTQMVTDDFQRTADTWANSVRVLKQSFEQLAGIIGGALINAFKPFVQGLNKILQKVISFVTMVTSALGAIFGWKYEISAGGLADDWSDAANSAGDMANNTGDAAKNAKKLKNYLLGIDELNVLDSSSDDGSGSGKGNGGGASGGAADGKFVQTDTIFKDYESEIKNLGQLGNAIRDALIKSMQSIDWKSIYEKARGFGTGLAEFLNGLFEGTNGTTLFGELGRTIASALNAVVYAALAFGVTFDWAQFGVNIADGVNNFFNTFDFTALAETINVWVQGIWDTLSTAIAKIDWMTAYDKIIEFLENLDIKTIAIIIGALTIKKIASLNIASSILKWIGVSISKKIAAEIGTALGLQLASGAGLGTALSAAGGAIANTFLAGFKAVLGSQAAGAALAFVNPVVAAIAGIGSAITGIVLAIPNFVSMWQNGFSLIKEAIMLVGLALTAVGAVILGAPALVAGVVAGIVATVATIAIVAHDNWNEIKKVFSSAGEWFNSNVITPIVQYFQELWQKVSEFFTQLWKDIENIWSKASGWFNDTVINPIITFFSGFQTRVSQIFTGLWIIVQAIWIIASTWFDQNVIQPIIKLFKSLQDKVSQTMKNLWETIKSVWNVVSSWFDTTVASPVKEIFSKLKEKVSEIFTTLWETIKGVWSSVSNWFETTVITPLKTAWETACKAIEGFFTNLWASIKTGVVNAMNSVIQAIENALNFMIDGINSVIESFNDIVDAAADVVGADWDGVDLVSRVTLTRVPAFETGGFPEDGLFFANHSEMVGQFSNGRSAVVNNEQIVAGISAGVKSAVSEVLAPYLSQIAQNTREFADKDTSINIDGREMVNAINARVARNGYSFT